MNEKNRDQTDALQTITVTQHGRNSLVNIPGADCGVHGDLSGMVTVVEQLVAAGETSIAIVFEEGSYLYTRAIVALVRCHTLTGKAGGLLTIIAPNPLMMRALKLAGVNAVIRILASVEELPE